MCFADDNGSEQLVRTLMQKSGLKKQIEQIPQLMQAELDRQQEDSSNISKEDFNRFSRIMKSAFDPKTIHAAVQKHILLNMAENDMKEVLSWLDSPLGTKITKLEEDASTAEAFEEIHAIGPKLLNDNKDTSRMNKYNRLDKAMNATQSTVNTVMNIQLAMITAMSSAMESDIRPSFEDAQELIKKIQPQIQAEMRREIQIQFSYTYRLLTDYEIDRYIRFAETESGQRYHQVTTRAINNTLVQAARNIGSRLGMRINRM